MLVRLSHAMIQHITYPSHDVVKKSSTYCDLEDITVHRWRCTCSMLNIHTIDTAELSKVETIKLVKLVILFCCILDWIMAGIAGIGRCIEMYIYVYLAGLSLLPIRGWFFPQQRYSLPIYIFHIISHFMTGPLLVCLVFIICNWNR